MKIKLETCKACGLWLGSIAHHNQSDCSDYSFEPRRKVNAINREVLQRIKSGDLKLEDASFVKVIKK